MLNESKKRIDPKDIYEPGDTVIVLGKGQGEVLSMSYNKTIPVYSVKFEDETKECSGWKIMGAVVPDVSGKEDINKNTDERVQKYNDAEKTDR